MLKKYPFVKQKESKDCGIACLQMIFKYYNGYVNSLKLEELTKTTKNGTTAYHLIEALKYYDFEAKGIRCEIQNIEKQKLPAIAHVTINKTYNHYVVIYKVTKNFVLLADPSEKIKKMKLSDFNEIYNNVLIVSSPKKILPKYFESTSKKEFCLNILKNYKSLIYKLIIISFLVTLFSVLTSFYLKYMLDNLGIFKNINFVFIIFLHFYILNIMSNYFRNKLLIHINKYIDYDITTITFKQIITLPYRYYASKTTGDIISRISDLEILKQTISKFILTIFVDICLILISFVGLYFINYKLFLISIIMLMFYVIILIIYREAIRKNIDKCQTEKANITSYMVESINNYENIKGINLQNKITSLFEKKYSNYLSKLLNMEKIYTSEILFKNIVSEIGFALIIYIGILEVSRNNLSIGMLMTFNALFSYLINPFKEMIDLDNDISSAFNSLNRILELYYKEKDNGIISDKIKGNIEFKDLSFSYDDLNYTLKNVNFKISCKEKVLILGESGSGKSTILKIIKKYYKVNRNNVLLDNIDINDYQSSSVSENISYISQNENLYTDTLYNNIDLYRNINSKEIYEASKICEIDFIDEKLGYDMLIEENGFNLSGGQKQRIILARSILKKFNILLIDEATNQIDYNLERKILKKIFKKYHDKTIIMVSHRLENMDLFDKIIKVEKGRIKEVITKNA